MYLLVLILMTFLIALLLLVYFRLSSGTRRQETFEEIPLPRKGKESPCPLCSTLLKPGESGPLCRLPRQRRPPGGNLRLPLLLPPPTGRLPGTVPPAGGSLWRMNWSSHGSSTKPAGFTCTSTAAASVCAVPDRRSCQSRRHSATVPYHGREQTNRNLLQLERSR